MSESDTSAQEPAQFLQGRNPRAGWKAILNTVRLVFFAPLVLPLLLTDNRGTVLADVRRWAEILFLPARSDLTHLLMLVARFVEFRNLYYYRTGRGRLPGKLLVSLLRILYPGCSSLFINCYDIGPGLYIQHGFATVIAAKSVGANCWINQQVTIGFRNGLNQPVIGNNVTITAGAKVLGGITVGDNVIVGANAVVIRDVPRDCTVAGVPARIIRRNGIPVRESL